MGGIHDIRSALHALRRTPGFTIVAVATLALGIGANTAIFTVVHSVLLEPLAFHDADRLVRIFENVPGPENRDGRPRRRMMFPRAELGEVRARARTLASVAAQSWGIVTVTGQGEATRVQAAAASGEIFPMLGAVPLTGRFFEPGETTSVVLSYGFWQQHFGGDPAVVGRPLTIQGVIPPSDVKPYTIVGVLPQTFHYLDLDAQVWMPSAPFDRFGSPVVARLAAGVSLGQAAKEVAEIVFAVRGHPEQAGPGQAATPPRFEIVRVQDELVAPVKPALLFLMMAVGFVLLISCVNVANLLFARTAARQREISIRIAVGASRGRIIRYLLAESALLALTGGTAGIVLALGGVRVLRVLGATINRADLGAGGAVLPRLDEITLHPQVLAFTLAASVLTAVLCGVAPAVRYSRLSGFDLQPPRRMRGALVVAEIAMAMMLLVAGGLLMHSFVNLARVDPGYDAVNVVTFQIALPGDRYPGPRLKAFAEDVVARLRAIPAVRGAAYANQLPLVGLRDTAGGLRKMADPNSPPVPDGPDARVVSRDYVKVMGIRVVAGRGLGEQDDAGQPGAIVINRALARRQFANENPIGQTVYVGRFPNPWQIVGIVEDVRQFGLDRPPEPQFFIDMRQWPGTGLLLFPVGAYYAVRTTANPAEVIAAARRQVRDLEAEAGLFNAATMEELVATTIARPRLYAVLLGIFAAVGVVLAAVGIYGVLAYSVTQRTREIGIRMALGARRSAVLRLVLGQSFAVTALGIGLGVAGAAWVTRYLKGMLFGLTPLDPITFVAVSILFAAIAAIAAFFPAHRAATVNPVVALRAE
jgi:predicted permease